MTIKVLICGCAGRMGKEVVKAVNKEPTLKIVAGVDIVNLGEDIGKVAGVDNLGINIEDNLDNSIKNKKPDVMVDFTTPQVVMDNIRCGIKNKVNCVVGTTGFTDEMLKEVENLAIQNNVGCIIAPNFAIGAVLMMEVAKRIYQYMPNCEIIELHHDKKLDAPSGTAIKTAEELLAIINQQPSTSNQETIEKIKNVRGGILGNIRIHSVRLPGLVAHQEIIFGGVGQILTLRHDSITRESFIPGVIMAIKKVVNIKGLIYGLEKIL